MKKTTIVFMAVISLIVLSCNKSDDPDPVPLENYTVTYSVIPTGVVNMDTIAYLGVDGNEVILTEVAQLSHSFVQPSNNYHGKIRVRGEIGELGGSCSYSMTVLDKSSNVIYFKNSEVSGAGSFFLWTAEYSSSSK